MPSATVSLIGMPGAGKSTVGVLLAKRLGLDFVDTDLLIQVRHHATLQEIVDARGYLELRKLEEEVLLEMTLEDRVVSTGGSAVYSETAMRRLAAAGPLVHIDVPLEVLRTRIIDESGRGIARPPGQDLEGVFGEREPLYRAYANFTVADPALSAEATALAIQNWLGRRED
jgi:shikimate kinase